MKTIMLLLTGLFFSSEAISDDFKQLTQLVGGTWVMQGKSSQVCERWEVKDGNTLVSKGFTVAGKDTSWQESVSLTQTGNIITYISVVHNQNDGKAVAFKYTGMHNGAYHFSNPQHDFPQNIAYRFITKDSLHAWISGTVNGKQRRSDFYYNRR